MRQGRRKKRETKVTTSGRRMDEEEGKNKKCNRGYENIPTSMNVTLL